MRASGVICEFNPFHNGHAYLLSRMREQVGVEGCVVCLMSGRFVQRGEPAIADPYLRAEAALAGGADLVLELPFPWSAAGAEHFALGGVRILTLMGVDTLTFGSESGDIALLSRAAELLHTSAFRDLYASLCRSGMGTAAAYAAALQGTADPPLPVGFPSSNDLLGIAYLNALQRVAEESHIPPIPQVVTRVGSGYREDTVEEGKYPSATALRLLMREAAYDPEALEAMLTGTMPEDSLNLILQGIRTREAPVVGDPLQAFYHLLYRITPPEEREDLAEWGGGLAAHVSRTAKETATPTDFFSALRTKQYTDSRLRRALLFGALHVTDEDIRAYPSYTTLLAANARGRAFLKAWKRQSKDTPHRITVVTKPADAPLGRERELSELADSLFTLCFPSPRDAGDLLRRKPRLHP